MKTEFALTKKQFTLVNIVEELLELVGYDVPKDHRSALMHEWKKFIFEVTSKKIALFVGNNESTVPDALCDIITFPTGGLMKNGHNPLLDIEQCGKELKAVCNLNLCPKQHREFKAKVAMDEHNSQLEVVRKLVELYLAGKIEL